VYTSVLGLVSSSCGGSSAVKEGWFIERQSLHPVFLSLKRSRI
jgi:hypothetical protein